MTKNDVLKEMPKGLYVVSAIKHGEELKTRDVDYIAAATISWAMPVSFDPAIVSIAVELQHDLNETIDYSGKFCLHLLDEQNEAWGETFARASKIEGNSINGVAFEDAEGFVHLEGAKGYVDCKIQNSQTVGDHTVYFAKIEGVRMERENSEALSENKAELHYNEN